MLGSIVDKQINEFRSSPENVHLYYPESFGRFLSALRGDGDIESSFLDLLADDEKLLVNLDLILKMGKFLFIYVSDQIKFEFLRRLHEMFFKGDSIYLNERIKSLCPLFLEFINSKEIREKAIFLIRQILAKDPCNEDFKSRIEELIGRDIPGFTFRTT